MELKAKSECDPQKLIPPYKLLHALPEPILEINDAFLKKKSSLMEVSSFSKLIIHNDKALIPLADDAIPLLCGKLFELEIVR